MVTMWPRGLLVPVADHCRQRGGFAGSRAAHQDHEAALGKDNLPQHGRQVELLESRNLGVDGAQHRARKALLHEGADSKAPDPGRRDREIALLRGIELLGLPIVHDGAHQAGTLLRGQGTVRLGTNFAVHLDGRRKARGDEQIRAFLLDHSPQQILHQSYCLFAFHVLFVLSYGAPCAPPPSSGVRGSREPR